MTQPSFHDSLEALKPFLRLSGLPSDRDAEQMLVSAVQETRLGMRRILGDNLFLSLSAMPDVDPPLTTAQTNRQRARLAEQLWVRSILLLRLPAQFTDAGAGARAAWNDEGTVVARSSVGLRRQSTDAMNEALVLLDAILGVDSGVVTMQAVEPAFPFRPFDSLRGRVR